MKKFNLLVVVLLLTLFSATPAVLALELSPMFTDNAVLQRDIDVPVWGWAKAGSEVTITFAGQNVKAKVNEKGYWCAKLKPMKANKEPQILTVEGDGKKEERKNILVGEVWFCSGQSNMEWFTVSSLMPKHIDPDKLPMIRQIKFQHRKAGEPIKKARTHGGWHVCNKKNVESFTGVGFFFAERLAKDLDVPVGLIGSYWGNTKIESWIPEQGNIVLKSFNEKWPEGWGSNIYNGMVASIVPYAIRGALWYQGESNGSEGETYFQKQMAMIEGWRKAWNQGDFPVYFCQLANYGQPKDDPKGGHGWSRHREGQRKTLTIKNTGMAVLTDVGEPGDIHPKNKFDVGNRLALWALAKDYGKKGLVYSGPLYKSAEFKGGKAIVSFDHATGLKAAKKEGPRDMTAPKPVEKLEGFAIAGADKKWFWADAKIEGDKVVVTAEEVKEPAAVRYIFTMNTDRGNLYNGANLPASPFRTDEW